MLVAEAIERVTCRESLGDARRSDPELASQILFNFARHLSSLLRGANATLRGTDDWHRRLRAMRAPVYHP